MTTIYVLAFVFANYSECYDFAAEHVPTTSPERVAFCIKATSDTDAPLVSLRPRLRP